MLERRENVTYREFDAHKEDVEGKMDALFSEIKELNHLIRDLLIDRASDKAFALIGKWCLVAIPAITGILGLVALFKKG